MHFFTRYKTRHYACYSYGFTVLGGAGGGRGRSHMS